MVDQPHDETDLQQMGRLDRDSIYRINALDLAVQRASLFRDILKEDTVEVFSLAEIYYNWLKGDGEGHEPPRAETLEHRKAATP